MAREAFLVNAPPKKKKKAKAKRKSAPRGLTKSGRAKRKPGPKKGSARKAVARRKTRTKAIIKRVRRAAPRKVRVGKRVKRTGKIRRVSINRPARRRRKSYRRNPVAQGSIFNLKAFKANLPYMVTGGVSAIATTMAPGLVEKVMPNLAGNVFAKYGSQVGMTLVGAFAMDKTLKKGHGTIWMIVGGATIAADLIKQFIMPQLGLSGYELEGDGMSGYELEGAGDEYYENIDSLEAFPSTEDPYADDLGAFPDAEPEFAY